MDPILTALTPTNIYNKTQMIIHINNEAQYIKANEHI